MKLIAALLALSLAACAGPVEQAAVVDTPPAATECHVTIQHVLELNAAHGWKMVKLDPAQVKLVADEFATKDGADIDSDEAYVARHDTGDEDHSEVVLIAFANKGCFLGAARIEPMKLAQILSGV
jgi:hypothetical protein